MMGLVAQKYVDGKQFIWDVSSLDTVADCPQAYNFKVLQGWRKKTDGAAQAFGTAVHAGLEHLDRAKFAGLPKDAALDAALTHLLEKFGPQLVACEDNRRDLFAAMRALTWRADQYYEDAFRLTGLPDGQPAVEVRFEVPIEGTEWRLSGRVDRLIYNEHDGHNYLSDYKTTISDLSSYYFARYFPSNQVFGYLWACNKLGLGVKGFIVEGVQSGVNFTRFARQKYEVGAAQLEEWERDMRILLAQVEEYHKVDHWPKRFNACNNKGGCDFVGVCSRPPEWRQRWLEEDFVRVPYKGLNIPESSPPSSQGAENETRSR